MLAAAALLLAPLALATLPTAEQQRAAYRHALDQLTTGNTTGFRRSRQALDDYVLAPYLDYYDVQTRLTSVSDAEMQSFQQRYESLPVAPILHQRWLRQLGARSEWRRLLTHYRPSSDAELRCYHQRARLAEGQRDEALAEAAALWTVARSQPKACDPLFEAWIAAGHLHEGLAWDRLQLALAANEARLARYLLRFFDGPLKTWGQALYDVHINPRGLLQLAAVRQDVAPARIVIGHGIRRLARLDPAAAAVAWQRFQDTHAFADEDARAITEAVVLAMARGGEFPSTSPTTVSDAFAEGMAEAALAAENWSALLHWVERLPDARRADLRWRYWSARALQRSQLHADRAAEAFRALAVERHYYGFLAAEQVGEPTRLNAAPETHDPAVMARVEKLPAVQRAQELYAVGDLVNARREWLAVVPNLSRAERHAAARLTATMGWTQQAITIANLGELHDDVSLRFPIAYPDVFLKTSRDTAVPKPFLLAVARQESAFDARARSHANARGLMQLLHPTANQVARRSGLSAPTVTDLYDPAVNIDLGGRHLARLLERYRQQRPVAAAAYNAGEGRVDHWLQGAAGKPMDIWIETIPFRETRDYVKNVTAFTQVYGHLLDAPQPVLAGPDTLIN
jgi:soluble lytic murein transglycosylase